MSIKQFRVLATIAVVVLFAAPASAVVLFSDNFNTNTSANWTANKAPTATDPNKQTAQFAFDYSPFGIPAPPGSSDTLGLRLRANLPLDGSGNEVTSRPAGTTSGLSVSPTGKNFGSNYILSYDAWANFFGAPNAQGLADNAASEGGTNNVMFAAGTAGTAPLVAGNPNIIASAQMDGIGFATTADGGIGSDWRVFAKSTVPATPATGYYAAGTGADALSNANTFYTGLFPTQTAPGVQQTISTNEYGSDASNTQLGNMQAGSFGFAWHKVVVMKNNNMMTWDIDDTRVATVDVSAISLGGANIALGVSDVNGTTARHPSLVFTVFDNLVVTDIPGPNNSDFNNDGTVDGADFLKWQIGQGSPATAGDKSTGDADGDGLVNSADLNIWQGKFGGPPTAAAASAVPEPATAALFALGLAVLSVKGRLKV